MEQYAKQVADYGLGAGAVTSPIWLQYLQTTIGLFMLIGGAVLLVIRLAISWHELREKRAARKV